MGWSSDGCPVHGHHVPFAITDELRKRGVDVITAYEDGAHELPDSSLLDRSTQLRRVLFTQDDDLLAEAAYRQRNSVGFHGVIYAHQRQVSIGDCVRDLEMIAKACESVDVFNDVTYLPI